MKRSFSLIGIKEGFKMKRFFSLVLVLALMLPLLTACPTPPETLTVEQLLEQGEGFLINKDYDQALVKFLEVVEKEPANPRGYTGAAEAYQGQGKKNEAKSILEAGLEAIPEDESIRAALDVIINQEKEQEKEAAATAAVVKAEATESQEDVYTARGLVNALPLGGPKTILTNRLDVVQRKINANGEAAIEYDRIQKAEEAVEKAEASLSQADVDAARTLVNQVQTVSAKNDLNNRLAAVEVSMEEKKVEAATTAVAKAESSKLQVDVNSARTLVNQLKASDAKNDLTSRLNVVQAAIDEAKLEAAARTAVEKVEASGLQTDLDSARVAVGYLQPGTLKTTLTNRLNAVQALIESGFYAEAGKVQEATKAVVDAEASLLQADITKARNLVNQLQAGSSARTALTNRLNTLQTILDNAVIRNFNNQGITDATLASMVRDGLIPANVTHLYLSGNQITDLSPLAGLTNLVYLDLSNNQINDAGPLSGLTRLIHLNLDRNELTNFFEPLRGLTNLKYVSFRYVHLDEVQFTELGNALGKNELGGDIVIY